MKTNYQYGTLKDVTVRVPSSTFYNNEFGASASSPLASIELVLQATSRPFGVISTPHLCRKDTPSSPGLKSSSPRTKFSDIVGRYLHRRKVAYGGHKQSRTQCIHPIRGQHHLIKVEYIRRVLPQVIEACSSILRTAQITKLSATRPVQQRKKNVRSTYALIIRRKASTRMVCRSFCMMCCPRLGVFSYKEKKRW